MVVHRTDLSCAYLLQRSHNIAREIECEPNHNLYLGVQIVYRVANIGVVLFERMHIFRIYV